MTGAHNHGMIVTGTDTGVGKTIVTAALVTALQAHGFDAGIMKPVATGISSASHDSDPDWLVSVTGCRDDLELVSPYRLNLPAAPWVAARHEGLALDVERILKAFHTLSARHDCLIVEGIGGLLVPLSDDLFIVDLIARMKMPVLIVSRVALGSINHTLLTVECLKRRGIPILGVIFNHLSPPLQTMELEETVQTILHLSGLQSFGELPFCEGLPGTWARHRDQLVKAVDTQELLQALKLSARA